MKHRITLLITLLFTYIVSFSQEKIIELPLTIQSGYGPFYIGLGGISPISEDDNSPWKNTYLKVSKFPEGLTELKYGNIETNIYQSVYQDYILGNITKDWFEKLQKSWNWTPDTLNLSSTPLKTKIAFAYGKDSDGNLKIVIDANNNLDLSDDKLFSPVEMTPNNDSKKDSLAQIHAIDVSVETLHKGKICSVNIPLFVMYNDQFNMFMCNFSQYATTEYKGKQIAVVSGSFTELSYQTIKLAFTNNHGNNEKIKDENLYRKNEYIEIEGENYKILGVNTNKNVLVLEKIFIPKTQLISTQIGYKPFPIEGESLNKSVISLESLKGKYVLLDFWAVWCGPCLEEIPELRELYSKVDKSQFEIIGIAGDSPAKSLNELIDKYKITWPQILSDDENNITVKYGINGYPATFLLDKDGVIIAKNLRGKELKEKVLSLMEE